MAFWGPIIGAGISALGSLFGSNKKEQKTTTEVDYVKMAENAERAGFNPLTAIRNGGSAGFVTTTHPALSSWGSAFGEAAQILGNALMSWDPQADKRAALENRMLELQLASFDRTNRFGSDGFGTMIFGDVPTAQGSTRVGPGGRPIAIGDRTATNPFHEDLNIKIDPRQPDAEMAETRYGDLLQEVFGVGVLARDIYHHFKPRVVKDWATTVEMWKDRWEDAKPKPNSGRGVPGPYVPPGLGSTIEDPFASGWKPSGW